MLWLTGLCNILLPTLSLVILNTIVVRTIEKHAQVVMIKLMVVLVMMFGILKLVILNTIIVRTIEKHVQVIKLMVVLVMMFTQGYQSCQRCWPPQNFHNSFRSILTRWTRVWNEKGQHNFKKRWWNYSLWSSPTHNVCPSQCLNTFHFLYFLLKQPRTRI